MRPCTLRGHLAQGAISVYCTARRARWNSCRTLQGSAIFRWTADMMIGGDDLITDDSIIVDGNAKINLTLDILGKRPDGYHEVAMVMQSIGLHDTVKLSKIPRGIELVLDVPGLEADEQNLAWRAAQLLLGGEETPGGVRIELTKRIPIAAGLAGGSADAAAVLRGVNALYHLGLTQEELCAYGAKLGSDIPFCIMGGTMMATGRGEVLEALSPVPPFWVVLAKPKISVSTAWAYRNYDEQGTEVHPDNAAIREKIAGHDREGIASLLCNVLERVTIKQYPVIAQYKAWMMEKGALASMMSGSGPTVFGLFSSEGEAQSAAAYLEERTDADIFVCQTADKNHDEN